MTNRDVKSWSNRWPRCTVIGCVAAVAAALPGPAAAAPGIAEAPDFKETCTC